MDREHDAGLFGKPAVTLWYILAAAGGKDSALLGDSWVYARVPEEHLLVSI
jgi:hypothetical protein